MPPFNFPLSENFVLTALLNNKYFLDFDLKKSDFFWVMSLCYRSIAFCGNTFSMN